MNIFFPQVLNYNLVEKARVLGYHIQNVRATTFRVRDNLNACIIAPCFATLSVCGARQGPRDYLHGSQWNSLALLKGK